MKAQHKYYEIIDLSFGLGVVGVCTDPNDDTGVHEYGLITAAQYYAYKDRPWEDPKSRRRFRLVPQPKRLLEIK